jgi:heme a synthase
MAMSFAQTLPATAQAQPSLPRERVFLCRFAWGVLAYNIAVILWGALVRATGSGAGCGDHWPLCNGVVIQAHPRIATIIELTHRRTSGVAVFAMLVLLLWTFRSTPRKHLARASAVAAAVLTFNEALLGALLVLLRLTADNRSGERAVYLSLHLANTLLLLAALALCAHFSSRRSDSSRGTVHLVHLPLGLLGLTATLAVGVSGSLAALGDTLYPAATLRAAFTADFSEQSSWLLRLRFIHPLSALIAGLFICWLVRTAFRRSRHGDRLGDRRLGVGVVALLLLQIGLGLGDVLLLAPVWMQIVHLLGADLLWVALVVLTARVCAGGPSKTAPFFS